MHGRTTRGERHPFNVISELAAKQIKHRVQLGQSTSEISRAVGVLPHHVKNIRLKKAWTWLEA